MRPEKRGGMGHVECRRLIACGVGAGNWGKVHVATYLENNQAVAVKTLKQCGRIEQDDFIAEAKVRGPRIHHGGVLSLCVRLACAMLVAQMLPLPVVV